MFIIGLAGFQSNIILIMEIAGKNGSKKPARIFADRTPKCPKEPASSGPLKHALVPIAFFRC